MGSSRTEQRFGYFYRLDTVLRTGYKMENKADGPCQGFKIECGDSPTRKEAAVEGSS